MIKCVLRALVLPMVLLHPSVHAVEYSAGGAIAGRVVFISGQVSTQNPAIPARTLENGAPVYVGDHIQTQSDSYLHLRMVDKALVALRPTSSLTIEVYEYNASHPEASRIRLDLQHGTSRAVTGKGGQAAKHQYRFNTPLAAIGLRGTDYTVIADPEKTRVSVMQGGVIVSPFHAGCTSAQLGPCISPLSRELTASMPFAFIEVSANQAQSVHMAAATPRNSPAENTIKDALFLSSIDHNTTAIQPPVAPVAPAAPTSPVAPVTPIAPVEPVTPDINTQAPNTPALARWGRWSSLVQEIPEGSDSINQVFGTMTPFTLVGSNSAFALAHPSNTPISVPMQGKANFTLLAAEAYLQDKGQFSPAQVKNGVLEMDFGKNSFNTQLTVQTQPGNLEQVQAHGTVDRYGRMQSVQTPFNTNISGILLNKGLEATYLFDKTLPSGSNLTGATQWGR